jgi:hypothetical protein
VGAFPPLISTFYVYKKGELAWRGGGHIEKSIIYINININIKKIDPPLIGGAYAVVFNIYIIYL